MDAFHRILRYLILWAVIFVVLIVLSVVRYWDTLVAILSATFSSTLYSLFYYAILFGLIIWGFRLLFGSAR